MKLFASRPDPHPKSSTECPLPAAEILRVMPTDDEVDGLFAAASGGSKREDGAPDEHGTGIVWEEFHMPTKYRQ